MATDIAGWVEIKRSDHWFGVVEIQVIIKRNYGMFNFLFAGRNESYENPIAAHRGEPVDISREAQQKGIETWISLDEIKQIDWEQHQDIFTDDWRDLFQIMTILYNQERTQDVRLLVYFF